MDGANSSRRLDKGHLKKTSRADFSDLHDSFFNDDDGDGDDVPRGKSARRGSAPRGNAHFPPPVQGSRVLFRAPLARLGCFL